ncbi:hypothetical protein PLEOSDRAFT_1070585 [Pleurotus ostreatus PC15]|uniref:Uncharacterized protein n=1 Tax=Pleurotus ostreatus (strain PC15) TaxID=1137138 RepID=A0A067NUF5_PLEO1|nr:hypothetical protein PLEOSDRAFT_1070585 [Pleurotus ostreatus PC15]
MKIVVTVIMALRQSATESAFYFSKKQLDLAITLCAWNCIASALVTRYCAGEVDGPTTAIER